MKMNEGVDGDDGHLDMMSFTRTKGYSQGFFSCFKDLPTTIFTYFCSCVVVGITAGKLWNDEEFDVNACICAGNAAYRIRRHTQILFGISESESASSCAVGCFGCCAVVQVRLLQIS
ncbi:hypothetical protein BC829DRAFT_390737 [Chytridium lagenaria]|nr:hypothetical protein BC829DRAFT_390737 [Chytridium lagenaria]